MIEAYRRPGPEYGPLPHGMFYLGSWKPHWLETLPVPQMITRRYLAARKSLPRARVRWALDSGAYGELRKHGDWSISHEQYAREVRRFYDEVGGMDFCAIMDWPVDEASLEATGLWTGRHQMLSAGSYFELMDLAPDLPWMPVLQGQTVDDYWRHLEIYQRMGWNEWDHAHIGIGSIAKTQHEGGIDKLVETLSDDLDQFVHGFGVKRSGLPHLTALDSSDSMVWSFIGRKRRVQLPGCTHQTCGSCDRYAIAWRNQLHRDLTIYDPYREAAFNYLVQTAGPDVAFAVFDHDLSPPTTTLDYQLVA